MIENQTIDIADCTLALQNVSKLNGHCPMADVAIPIEICKEVKTTFVTSHETHIPTCATSHHKFSFWDPSVARRDAQEDGGDVCKPRDEICCMQEATCNPAMVKVPKSMTCPGDLY